VLGHRGRVLRERRRYLPAGRDQADGLGPLSTPSRQADSPAGFDCGSSRRRAASSITGIRLLYRAYRLPSRWVNDRPRSIVGIGRHPHKFHPPGRCAAATMTPRLPAGPVSRADDRVMTD